MNEDAHLEMDYENRYYVEDEMEPIELPDFEDEEEEF